MKTGVIKMTRFGVPYRLFFYLSIILFNLSLLPGIIFELIPNLTLIFLREQH